MSKLIGTNPNQVPSNADLGTAAFMDKKEFLLSKGSSLSAINAVIPKTAVDVFVYDTRKDSDGGAWRKRTQHTSWYNERLNTTTRGSRKEFPAVAVIVATVPSGGETKVIIYDADDPTLPMWMELSARGVAHAQGPTTLGWYTSGTPLLTAVTAFNGIVGVVGDGGLRQVKFVSDSFRIGYLTNSYVTPNNISQRENKNVINEGSGGTGGDILVWYATNDVAMTVLPNAPIDADTGLPVPTIAVATDGGVSVIKDDGNVVDITNSNASFLVCDSITLNSNGRLSYVNSYSGGGVGWVYVFNSVPSADNVITINTKTGSTQNADALYDARSSSATLPYIDLVLVGPQDDVDASTESSFGSVSGVTLLDENTTTPTNGAVAYIASDYNTGWMHGDIKLATLSDTDTTNVTYANLITNGAFASNITGWSNFTGSVAHDTTAGGRIAVTSNGSYYGGVQTLTAVAGKTYALTFTAVSGTTGARIRAGNASSGTNYLNAAVADGTHTYFFTTDTTTTVRIFLSTSGASGTCYFDNITLSLAERDHTANSVGDSNTKELKVFGTITKTAVATGADLVGYSGFSSSNYLQQPYNSDFNFGTGDFCVMGWINPATQAAHHGIVNRMDSGGGAGFLLEHRIGGTLLLQSDDGTTVSNLFSTSVSLNVWSQFCCTVTNSGTSLEWFINGVSVATATVTARNVTNTAAVCRIGEKVTESRPMDGSLALIRISATAPTAEQIAKMYNDEKHLFATNAKATLYGSSDAVTALAYDDDTELLHVGTSAGRSVFQGLRRVDNTTDAVGAAISASNGFIVEE